MAKKKRLIYDEDLLKPVDYSIFMVGRHSGKTRAMYEAIFKKRVELAPTVDAVEVVHGHWRYYSTTMQECSNCQRHTARHRFKYCPHCGAVMEDKYNDG